MTGDLAQSYTVSPDKLTYTFKLHPNVKFHDGTPCTSADVKASYDRMRNPPQGVVSTRKATFADIPSIESPDPLTVVFKLKAVNAAILQHFGSPGSTSTPRRTWRKIRIGRRLTSTAPELSYSSNTSRQPSRRQAQRELFRRGLPYLDGFKGVFFLQAATMLNAFQGGQVQAEFRSISEPENNGSCRPWATRSGSRS